MLTLASILRPTRIVDAHCDVPCGIYDPVQARIEAESIYNIVKKHNDSDDKVFRARCIHVKEERAELAKHHINVLWSDYFKPEHVQQFPDLQQVCWQAAKQCSQVKHTVDLADAQKLLDLIDQIDEMWKATGGPEKTRLQKQTA
jgi:nickel superoxide dismutase